MEQIPLYSSRIIYSYLQLIKNRYSYIDISKLLDFADMQPHEVQDQSHWFTQDQIDRFYERAVKLTRNENLAREAGRYASSPDTMGVMRQYLMSLVGPAKVFEFIEKATPHFTISSKYVSKRIDKNKIEVYVTPREGITEKPFQCENRMGYFEAVSLMFNKKLLQIEHPECMFKGHHICRYVITWQESDHSLWRKIRNISGLTLIAINFILYFFVKNHDFNATLSISLLVLIALSWYSEFLEKKQLAGVIDNLRDSTDQLVQQIGVNYNNALLVNEIGLVLSKKLEVDDIMTNAINVLEKRLDYDRGLILLNNPEKTRLIFRTGFGYTVDQISLLIKTRFHLDLPDSKGVFIDCYQNQKPILVNDIDEIKKDLSTRSLEVAQYLGARSFICCPIIYENESLGVLAVDNVTTKRPLLQRDINLLMGIAPEIGMSIHNAILLETQERQFKSTLQALAASIDARDPLTAGHSARVTEYAVGICKQLNLTKDRCEVIRVAALLHDYGKIGVRDSVLKKPGRLTADEYEEIKTHVIKTKSILEEINFEGIYKDVPTIASAHHERLDGSGYPLGLEGDAIPMGAKILAVADFFEAVTSKRHYREPMPFDAAFDILAEKAGKRFDEEAILALYNHLKQELKNTQSGFMPQHDMSGEYVNLSGLERKSLNSASNSL